MVNKNDTKIITLDYNNDRVILGDIHKKDHAPLHATHIHNLRFVLFGILEYLDKEGIELSVINEDQHTTIYTS